MIYFVKNYGAFVKIGTSVSVDERCKTLQTANPRNLRVIAVLEGSFQTETGLHTLFEKSRKRGEWFKYTEEIKWFVRAIHANPDINNIYTLHKKSLQMRLTAKAKRLGKNHPLSKALGSVMSN